MVRAVDQDRTFALSRPGGDAAASAADTIYRWRSASRNQRRLSARPEPPRGSRPELGGSGDVPCRPSSNPARPWASQRRKGRALARPEPHTGRRLPIAAQACA